MEDNKNEIKEYFNDRVQNILNNFSKCKKTFMDDGEERKNLGEINKKIIIELKEARELEKSHRYHLMTSREMIANLQETVSHLVYLKREVKKLKDVLVSKDSIIDTFGKEKENVMRKHNEVLIELRAEHDKEIKDLEQDNGRRVQQVQIESDTQIAQMTCLAAELRSRIKHIETDHREKIDAVVLDYEEKLQHQTQLQERASKDAEASRAHLHAYRRKLEILEEKLKQSQFKQYLAQSIYPPQCETTVERPYCLETTPTQLAVQPPPSEGEPKTNEDKGLFHISKKRKLYTEKGFLNM